MPQYSRSNPSPRYLEMAAMYQEMHNQGDARNEIPAQETFDGRSLLPHVQIIGNFIRSTQSKSLLDYGCGKAGLYERATASTPDGKPVHGLKAIWGLDEVRLYDPGYKPHSTFPEGYYDTVISTDVLEHITAEDLDWVVTEILGFARKCVYLNIACYPAKKILPNGENAHVTQESPGWWVDLVHTIKRDQFDHLKVILAIDDKTNKRVFSEF